MTVPGSRKQPATPIATRRTGFGRLRVPPDHPQFTLRRVWLTKEEEDGFYFGFANKGLWRPAISHTRVRFSARRTGIFQAVNRKFADALLEEMEGESCPFVLVQDYHFALLPRMVKERRPDARVAIFWHIPWPNPEAFGICPWESELLDGMLGADLIGFHIQAHCNDFSTSKVTVLVRRDEFRGSKIMQDRAFGHPKVEVRWNTEVTDVRGDMTVTELALRDTATGEESTMPAQGMFVAIGYKPNTDLFKGQLDLDPRGYCKTAADGDTNSNVEGVFVAGDVHDHRYRQAVTAAGDGCKAAIDVERWLESIGEVERVTATNW